MVLIEYDTHQRMNLESILKSTLQEKLQMLRAIIWYIMMDHWRNK